MFGLLLASVLAVCFSQLVLQPPPLDRQPKLKFGQSVALPSDSRLVVGANGYSNFRGAVYLYDLQGSGDRIDHWKLVKLESNQTQEAEEKKPRELRVVSRGSGLGFSVAAGSTCVVAGAPGHDLQRGAAFVFREEQGWKEEILVANDRRGGDLFGWSVSVDHNCEWILVGAKGRRANNGQAFLFRCFSTCEMVYEVQATERTDQIGPNGIRIRNNFGVSVAVWSGGFVVGCTGWRGERGSVYVYEQEEEWKLKKRWEGEIEGGFFGYKVSVSVNGSVVLVGADGEENYKGAVYVIENGVKERVVGRFRQTEDNFGGSVGLSRDGAWRIVGVPGRGKDYGMAYLYKDGKMRERIWPGKVKSEKGFFGWDVDVEGDVWCVSAPDVGEGVVVIGRVGEGDMSEEKDEL